VGFRNSKSATPQYCGQPNRLRFKKIAVLRLRTTSAISQLSAVSCQFRYFLVLFRGFKNQPNTFLQLSVFMETKNIP
jgi:hypothetical protein